MKLPKHIALTIEHDHHKVYYETVEQYLQQGDLSNSDVWISEEDKQFCLENNTLWLVYWYPHTPVGYFNVYGSDLNKILEYIDKTNSFS